MVLPLLPRHPSPRPLLSIRRRRTRRRYPLQRRFLESVLRRFRCRRSLASFLVLRLQQLNQTFVNRPFMVKLWGRSETSGDPNSPQMVDPRTDSLLGIAKLPLLQLLQSTPLIVSVPSSSTSSSRGGGEGRNIERRMFGAQVPVVLIPAAAETQQNT